MKTKAISKHNCWFWCPAAEVCLEDWLEVTPVGANPPFHPQLFQHNGNKTHTEAAILITKNSAYCNH